MGHYNPEIKEAMVAKLCSPGGPSLTQLSLESGIASSTLHSWIRKYGGSRQMGKSRRPQDWSAEDRLQAVIEASSLGEEALGAYLCSKGLHSSDLARWRQEAVASLTPRKRGRPVKDPALVAAEQRITALERDLRRKEKALAEQTALVVLQKKAEQIWGRAGDEE